MSAENWFMVAVLVYVTAHALKWLYAFGRDSYPRRVSPWALGLGLTAAYLLVA